MTVDGTIAPGEVVFAPGAVRVTELPIDVGLQVGPGQAVLNGTSDVRVVTVDLAADSVDLVAVGDEVAVDLPDGSTVSGTVSGIGTVAEAATDEFGNQSDPTVAVTISLDTARRRCELRAGAGRRSRSPARAARTCWRCRSTRSSHCSKAGTRSNASPTTARSALVGVETRDLPGRLGRGPRRRAGCVGDTVAVPS